jgi:stage II sporulation protein Q
MKERYKLKSWVVVCIYLFSIGVIISGLFLVGKTLKSSIYSDDNLSYVYRGLINDPVPVIKTADSTSAIIKPYDSKDVTIIKNFYDKDTDNKTQENSLILYENTYMPNTGTLYGSKTTFEVHAVLDGTIENITADEIMGNIVTIKHSNTLTTIYQSLNEVKVMIGDTVKQGDLIGTSGSNKVESSSENMLLFEVENNGTYINPEKFYEMKLEELS